MSSGEITINGERVVVRGAGVDEIMGVRMAVIIEGTDRATGAFDGDDAETTRHIGAFVGEQNVGCATYLCGERDREAAWQLRGMGVLGAYQGRGIGALLAVESERLLGLASPIRLMWCNAREGAVGFYERLGWTTASEAFDVKGVGLHRVLVKRLT